MVKVQAIIRKIKSIKQHIAIDVFDQPTHHLSLKPQQMSHN
jgi:hypothetical protein